MAKSKLYQNIILMRHGDRVDDFVESWRSEAARPWDPHLIDAGHSRALSTGQKLRTQLSFPIHRVFTSPFLRCIETASGVISGLCTIDRTSYESDPTSMIKATIEYGLCEAFNRITIPVPPKDGEQWGFNRPELETVFPVGMVDPTCEPVNSELPQWEETLDDARARFVRVIHALADKYPAENLLLVTHGKAVRGAIRTFLSNVGCRNVHFCGYLQLRREIRQVNKDAHHLPYPSTLLSVLLIKTSHVYLCKARREKAMQAIIIPKSKTLELLSNKSVLYFFLLV